MSYVKSPGITREEYEAGRAALLAHGHLLRGSLFNATTGAGMVLTPEDTALWDDYTALIDSALASVYPVRPADIAKGGAALAALARSYNEEHGIAPLPSSGAPGTWAALQAQGATVATYRERQDARALPPGPVPFPVDDSNSASCIFRPEDNYAFRAWHDHTHISEGAAFTLEGEARVFVAQALWAMEYGCLPLTALALYEEAYGQSLAPRCVGSFAENQGLFALAFLNVPATALVTRY